VAGALALLLSDIPGRSNRLRKLQGMKRTDALQSLVLSTVRELGEAGQNHRFGFGRLDVLRAMAYADSLDYIE
jgi:hypothetical protein